MEIEPCHAMPHAHLAGIAAHVEGIWVWKSRHSRQSCGRVHVARGGCRLAREFIRVPKRDYESSGAQFRARRAPVKPEVCPQCPQNYETIINIVTGATTQLSSAFITETFQASGVPRLP